MHKSSNSPYSTVGAREHIQETWNLWSWENVCKVLHPLPGRKCKTWLLNARRLPAYCICSTYYVHTFIWYGGGAVAVPIYIINHFLTWIDKQGYEGEPSPLSRQMTVLCWAEGGLLKANFSDFWIWFQLRWNFCNLIFYPSQNLILMLTNIQIIPLGFI